MTRINSVRRMAIILKSFSLEYPHWGVSELADKLGLSKATVQGDLITLTKEEILERDEKTMKYTLGPAMNKIARLAYRRMDLRECGLQVMNELSKLTKETITISTWVDGIPCCIERIRSQYPLNLSADIGSWYPLHAGSTGKVLLSFLRDEEREQLLEGLELPRYTENTITNISSLRKRINEIRERDYDVSTDERSKGVTSIGVPLRDYTERVVAVLVIGGPTIRFDQEKIDNSISLAKKAAEEISKKLGFWPLEYWNIREKISCCRS